MRLLVIGWGSIGRRHYNNLIALRGELNLAGVALYSTGQGQLPPPPEAIVFRDPESAAAWSPHAVLICNPTHLHLGTAQQWAERGVHLFIEKPAAHTFTGLDALLDTVARHTLVTMVACPLRFHPAMQQTRALLLEGAIGRPLTARAHVGSYLPGWRPDHDYRPLYSGERAQGTGVPMELIHEFDYLHWLFGAGEVAFALAAQRLLSEIDVEDVSEALVQHKNGLWASVHQDFVQQPTERFLHVVGAGGTLWCDLLRGEVRLYRAAKGAWETFTHPVVGNDWHADSLRQFVARLRGDAPDCNPLPEAAAVLRLALAVQEAGRKPVHVDAPA